MVYRLLSHACFIGAAVVLSVGILVGSPSIAKASGDGGCKWSLGTCPTPEPPCPIRRPKCKRFLMESKCTCQF